MEPEICLKNAKKSETRVLFVSAEEKILHTMSMDPFTRLEAWKKGILLLKEVYRLTRRFPSTERFEITAQIRSASASILANIAEGCGRYTFADKANKFVIARGECTETLAFLYMAIALEYLSAAEA